jgi:hypothetical protein
MPKIQTVDSKTGAVVGELKMGRSITAKTNANPIDPSTIQASATAAAQGTRGQPSTTEGQVVATPIDPKFDALAKREIAFRAKEAEFKAREAKLADQVKVEAEKALGSYKARLKSKPLDVLNEEGLTYDQLVEQAIAMVNNPQAAPQADSVNTKLEALEKRIEESTKQAAQAQRDAAVKQLRYDAQDLVDSDPSFETIKATESIDDVVNLIVRTYDETGKMMSVDQAAKLVEEELLAEAIKIASLSKVKAKAGLTPELVQETKQPIHQQQTTLTNNMNANRKLTARERAILAFNGKKL